MQYAFESAPAPASPPDGGAGMAPANEGLCASAAPTRVCIWTDAECVSGPTPSGRRHKARRRNPFAAKIGLFVRKSVCT